MSAPSSEQPVTGNLFQTADQARSREANQSADEQSLLRLYMDLAGVPESQARGVFMFISREPDKIK